PRHARTVKPDQPRARRPGRRDQDRLAGRGRDPDAGPEQRLPHADRDIAVHAVALALEERVLPDPRAHDQIATVPAERPRVSLASHATLLARVETYWAH